MKDEIFGIEIKTPRFIFLKNIFYSIKNLIKWFKIIWTDRDWDHNYLYFILKFKLERMRDYNKNHGHCVNSNITAQRIDKCVNILDKLIEDDFSTPGYEDDLKIEWIKTEDPELYEAKFNSSIPEDVRQNEYQLQTDRRIKHIKTLFSILEKRVETFWD